MFFGFSLLFISSSLILKNYENKPPFQPIASAGEITLLTPENITYITGMDGYFAGTYSFENENIGFNPSNWNVFEDGGYVNIKDSYLGHNEVVELCKNSGGIVSCRNLFENKTSGLIEFWFCSNRTDQEFLIRISDGEFYGGRIEIKFGDDGQLKVLDGIQISNIISYVGDTWYHLKIEWDIFQGDFDWNLSLNDTEVGTFSFYGNPFNLNRIIFSSDISSPSENAYFYIDAVGYSWDQEYEIGDNLYEGLLVNFETTLSFETFWCELDGIHYKNFIGNHTIPMIQYGSHSLQVFGTISSTTYSSNIVHFTTLVDRWGPSIIIKSPGENSIHIFRPPICEIEVNDPNGVNATYYMLTYGGVSSSLTKWEGFINSDVWNSAPDGEITITFYSQDDLGNWSWKSITVIRALKLLILIIGLPLLVCIASLGIWLFLRKRKKLRETVENMRYEDLQENMVIVKGKKYKNKSLEGLTLRNLKISYVGEIFGFEQLSELKKLNLAQNNLTSIKELGHSESLTELDLSQNKIVNLSGIEKLTNLKVLYLDENKIVDISPISGLSHLQILHIRHNDLPTLDPLYDLINLSSLCIEGNYKIVYSWENTLFKRLRYLDIRPKPTVSYQESDKVKSKKGNTKLIAFLILLPIVSLLVTLLILAIPYGIATRLGVGMEDYWTYIFQNGYFWPTFGVVLLVSPIITAFLWFVVQDY